MIDFRKFFDQIVSQILRNPLQFLKVFNFYYFHEKRRKFSYENKKNLVELYDWAIFLTTVNIDRKFNSLTIEEHLNFSIWEIDSLAVFL